MESFKGILTNEDATLLQQHIKKSREEWEDNSRTELPTAQECDATKAK